MFAPRRARQDQRSAAADAAAAAESERAAAAPTAPLRLNLKDLVTCVGKFEPTGKPGR